MMALCARCPRAAAAVAGGRLNYSEHIYLHSSPCVLCCARVSAQRKLLEVELEMSRSGNNRKVWWTPPLSQASEQKEKSSRPALTINAKRNYQGPATFSAAQP